MAKPLPCALEAYRNAPFGNPSSSHAVGQKAREALEDARRRIAKCINADPSCVYFVSTASEASAQLLQSAWLNGYGFLPSPFEHHAISENIIRPLSVDNLAGTVLCQMHSNNETGEILFYPSDKLNEGDLFLCDATSSIGHISLPFRGMDAMIADGIKFGGLPGAAFFAVSDRFQIHPIIRGGGQERGMRAGTENVPAICAMSAALEWHTERMGQESAYITKLRDLFLDCLDKSGIYFTVNTPLDRCIPHILNVSFPGCEGTALSLLMSERGVMCSAGAACSNGLNEPSHVLMAMFNDEARARSALRFSFSHENTEQEIIKAVSILAEEVNKLSALAPH